MHDVSVDVLRDILEAGLQDGQLLVDVRRPEEFSEGHIEGAVNIPLDMLPLRMGELTDTKEVFLYCRSGGRSGRAKAFLEGKIDAQLHNVLGGIVAWNA